MTLQQLPRFLLVAYLPPVSSLPFSTLLVLFLTTGHPDEVRMFSIKMAFPFFWLRFDRRIAITNNASWFLNSCCNYGSKPYFKVKQYLLYFLFLILISL